MIEEQLESDIRQERKELVGAVRCIARSITVDLPSIELASIRFEIKAFGDIFRYFFWRTSH